MAFFDFDNLKEIATDLAQTGVNKSKQMAEITKLKMANLSEEDNIKKAYLELGKLYYAEHGTHPDGAYASACEKVTAAKETIAANNDRIAELKGGDEEMADAAEEAAEAVSDAVDAAVDKASDAVDHAAEKVEEAVDAAEEKIQDVLNEIKPEN